MGAKSKKDYSEMSRKELEERVKEVHKMEHAERMQHTADLYMGYGSGKRDIEYNEMFSSVISGQNLQKLGKLYDGLQKAHKDKGGDLGDAVVTEWMKKFADTMLPPLGLGVDGKTQQNYTTLMLYIQRADTLEGGKGELIKEIKEAIKKGNGFMASGRIVEAIRNVQANHDLKDFYEFLLPDDKEHRPFREYAAAKIAEEAEKHLPREEKGKKFISQAIISQNLPNMYQHYAIGDYATIIANAKVDKKEKGKKQ